MQRHRFTKTQNVFPNHNTQRPADAHRWRLQLDQIRSKAKATAPASFFSLSEKWNVYFTRVVCKTGSRFRIDRYRKLSHPMSSTRGSVLSEGGKRHRKQPECSCQKILFFVSVIQAYNLKRSYLVSLEPLFWIYDLKWQEGCPYLEKKKKKLSNKFLLKKKK